MTTPNPTQMAVPVIQSDRDAAAIRHGYGSWQDMTYWADEKQRNAVEETARTLAAYRVQIEQSSRVGEGGALREAVKPWADFHGELPDYDHPMRCVYESGIQYAVELLAKELGVEDYEPCDGTEEFDGDLGGTLINIVKAAGSTDEHGDYVHPRELRERALACPDCGYGKSGEALAPVGDVREPCAWLIRETKRGKSAIIYGHMFMSEERAIAAAERMSNSWRTCTAVPVFEADGYPTYNERVAYEERVLDAEMEVIRIKRLTGLQVERPFAHCCAEAGGHVDACDCVNKDHGTAWFDVPALQSSTSAHVQELGRFGHHPDPATDYECEIDALIGMAYERLTMGSHPDLEARIGKAMEFRTLQTPGELRWLSQTFNGTREIYARKPAWVRWPEDRLAALSAAPALQAGGE